MVPHWPSTPTASGDSLQIPAPPEGLSPFSARVLDQLSLTAWLPAALVVANMYVVVGMYLLRDPHAGPTIANLEKAVTALNDKPVGVILAVIFGVVLVTLVTQSLEFTAIRLLEGYWGGSLLAAIPTWSGVQLQRLRLWLMDRRATKVERKAFRSAENRIRIDLRDSPELLSAIVLLGVGADISHLPAELAEAAGEYFDNRRWLRWASAHLRHRANSLYNRRSAFPRQRTRLLPTRLGNALRSAEDQLSGDVAGPKMRGYLYAHLDGIGPTLMHQHNQYRNRLDMYAVMTAVALSLGALDGWLLPTLLPRAVVIGIASGYAVLSYLSYRGAISAALDYGPILLAMDKKIMSSTHASSAAP